MIKTFKDFEKVVNELTSKNRYTYKGTLEEYLRSILFQTESKRNSQLTFDVVFEILEKAFDSEPIGFKHEWMEYCEPVDIENIEDTYECFLKTIIFQIADLKRMTGCGQLDNEDKYYGVTSPSGHSWYNFDPFIYLECGVRGLVDHFEIGNFSEEEIGWDLFIGLLELGRLYE